MKKLITVLLILLSFVGCDDADIASYNISKEADNFKIYRRGVFYNGVTGEYILEVKGYFSIEDQGNQLEMTVKTESGAYLKHFLGLSDNVTYFVEQIDAKYVSDKRYKTTFKPSVIMPMIEIR